TVRVKGSRLTLQWSVLETMWQAEGAFHTPVREEKIVGPPLENVLRDRRNCHGSRSLGFPAPAATRPLIGLRLDRAAQRKPAPARDWEPEQVMPARRPCYCPSRASPPEIQRKRGSYNREAPSAQMSELLSSLVRTPPDTPHRPPAV